MPEAMQLLSLSPFAPPPHPSLVKGSTLHATLLSPHPTHHPTTSQDP